LVDRDFGERAVRAQGGGVVAVEAAHREARGGEG
jgi:hypothetical protein